jgi:DNA-binding NtrC family response regulator
VGQSALAMSMLTSTIIFVLLQKELSMTKQRILVQWLGSADLRGLCDDLPKAQAAKILAVTGGQASQPFGKGPIKTLLQQQSFDQIYLLSNYPEEFSELYQQSLGLPSHLLPVKLTRPVDYPEIFSAVSKTLEDIKQKYESTGYQLFLHLSPGTPAMTAIWVLLGKTRYPATFLETSREGDVWQTEIPFDLLDIIPDVLRNSDHYLQHLSSEAPKEIEGFGNIIGESRAIRDAVGRAKRAAIRSISTLLLGESGTGKELFAQAMHQASPRRDKPFKAINCAALSQTLLESELFGHKRGAFTGADKDRAGAFEFADGGTLFLDEIGECDLDTQAKLLRVLQPVPNAGPATRFVCRLGEDKDRKVNVRIIAATNRNLQQAIETGKFREDLYYRLAAVTIKLPPLRERKADIPLIAEHLLNQINRQFEVDEPGYKHKIFSTGTISFMKEHHWPGNIRELYNALIQAAVLTDGEKIGRQELVASLGEITKSHSDMTVHEIGDDFDLEKYLNSVHAKYLERAMQQANGVKSHAAKLLGIKNYQTLDSQLKRLKVRGAWEQH